MNVPYQAWCTQDMAKDIIHRYHLIKKSTFDVSIANLSKVISTTIHYWGYTECIENCSYNIIASIGGDYFWDHLSDCSW